MSGSNPDGTGGNSVTGGNSTAGGKSVSGGNPVNGQVEERMRFRKDSLPGRRDALPPGSLPGVPTDPQADENREPPPNAPQIP